MTRFSHETAATLKRAWFLFALATLLCFSCCPEGTAQDQSPSARSVRILHSLGEPDRAQTGVIKNVLVLEAGRQVVTCGLDGTVCLWDIQQEKIVRRFAHPEFQAVYCMALINDRTQLLAAGTGPGVILWDIETGEQLKQFDHDNRVYSISVFDDQQSFLFSDNAGNVVHQRLDSDKIEKKYRDDSEDITALRITPDQNGFVSGNCKGVVASWKLGGKKPDAKYEGLATWVCCLKFSEQGGQLFGSDYSGNIALWNPEDQKRIWLKKELASDICWGQFISPEQLVVVDTDDAFYLMDRKNGKATKKSIVIPNASGFDLSADRKAIWTGGTNMLCGWNLDTGKRIFPGDDAMQFVEGINSLVVRGDRIYIASDKKKISVWSISQQKRLDDLEFLSSLAIDWDDYQILGVDMGLVVAAEGGYVVVDYDTGEDIHYKRLANSGFVKSPRSNCLTYVNPGEEALREVDLKTHKPRKLMATEAENPNISSHFHLDEHSTAIMVSSYPDVLEIWSWPQKKVIAQLNSEEDFDIHSVGQGLLIGLQSESEVVVYASPGRSAMSLDEATVQALIEQLNDPSYDMRIEAQERLIAGGDVVAEIIESYKSPDLETRIQLRKIKLKHATANLPNLKRSLDADPEFNEDAEVVCAAPNGEYFLVIVREGWKSSLLVCNVNAESWSVVKRHPLRSLANRIIPIQDQPDQFAIGHMDGTIDIVEVQRD